MWNARCLWTLHRDRPLSEATLRKVLLSLIERHSALRSEPADPYPIFSCTQEAFSSFVVCRKRMHSKKFPFVDMFERTWRWAFRHVWPRVRTMHRTPDVQSVPLTVKKRTSNKEEAHRELWNVPSFVPPFQVAFAPFGPA